MNYLFFRNNFIHGRTAVVVKNVLGTAIVRAMSICISFFMVPITIGYISAEIYGVWLTLSSIVTWLGFMDIGFTQGLKNKLTESIANNDWSRGRGLVSTTYGMMIVIFLPICILMQMIIPYIGWSSLLNVDASLESEIRNVMHVLVLFCCFRLIFSVILSVISAYQKVALSSFLDLVGQALSFLIIVVLTKTCPPSLFALSISITLMPLIVLAFFSFYMYSTKYKEISPSISCMKKSYVSDLFVLGYKFFVINMQVVILYQTTNVLISNVSSPIHVTEYNIAYKLFSVVMMAYTIITAPLWPAYTDAYAKSDYAWMKKTKQRLDTLFWIVVAICFLMVFVATPIYVLWVGKEVNVPFAMTLIVGVYVITHCYMNLNGTLIVGMGKVHLETIIVIIGMIVHIPLALLLSRFFSFYGIITSMTIITLSYGIVFHVQTNKLLNRSASGIWIK